MLAPAQTAIPAIDPPAPVVEAARAAGVHRLTLAGAGPNWIGDCARCRRPVVYIDVRRGNWRCWGCGMTGSDAGKRLVAA